MNATELQTQISAPEETPEVPEETPEVPEELAPVPKATKGTAIIQKRNLLQRAADIFLYENLADTKKRVTQDVIIPGIKDLVYDILTQAVGIMFYGDARSVKKAQNVSGGTYTSYGNFWTGVKQQNQPASTQISTQDRAKHNFANVVFQDRDDAVDTLAILQDAIERWNFARVADLYTQSGNKVTSVDFDYGWYDLGRARVSRCPGGWRLILPPCEPIKN